MTRVALLDVNVLIALFDAEHVHHEVAHDWFEDNRSFGWSTCPLTENGFVRVVANPARRGEITPISELVDILTKFCTSGHHEFWSDAVSLRDDRLFNVSAVHSHRHLTDVYLLGLAVKRGGRFITFDQNVPLAAAKGARREHLDVIAPAG